MLNKEPKKRPTFDKIVNELRAKASNKVQSKANEHIREENDLLDTSQPETLPWFMENGTHVDDDDDSEPCSIKSVRHDSAVEFGEGDEWHYEEHSQRWV